MRIIGMVACLWMLGAPACVPQPGPAPAPPAIRRALQDLPGSPADSTVRALKAALGAGGGPAWLYVVDGVAYQPGALEDLGLDSLDIVSLEVLKPSSHGHYLPHLRGPAVVITTRPASAPR